MIALMLITGNSTFASDKNKSVKKAETKKECKADCKDKKDCKDKTDCPKTCKPSCAG